MFVKISDLKILKLQHTIPDLQHIKKIPDLQHIKKS